MKIIDWRQSDGTTRRALLERPGRQDRPELTASVQAIIEQVAADGDIALRELALKFDGIAPVRLEVDAGEFAAAELAVPEDLKAALREAHARLLRWHQAGIDGEFEIDTAPGVRCGRIIRPIPRVGLYVPAGSAPLPSTALMLGVPSVIAGCPEVVLCTPPRADGRADPVVLVAAALCGIRRVFKLGGAQAIAAMGLGTASLPRCDKIFGPGNAYVTAAKLQLAMRAGGPGIDMPAGPSEVLVIADAGANPEWVASDLLAQAEHGADSQVILISDSQALLAAVMAELDCQSEALPRAALCRQALQHARMILVASVEDALAISNDYAPEHLILALREPRRWLPQVRSAGSVFLGDHAPEALGDYCSGTNHVLPTGGAARAWSGVSVASFQTRISVQEVDAVGIAGIGPCAVRIAEAEGLQAHARSVSRRLAVVQA